MFILHLFQGIPFWLQEDPITFGNTNEDQKPSTGGQGGEDLHSHHSLPFGALIDGQKRGPDTADHQHAEGDELHLIEGVRQVPGQESHPKAPQGQDTVESKVRALITSNDDVAIFRVRVSLWKGGRCAQPGATENHLNP